MSDIVEVKVPFENVNDETARLVAWEVKRGQEVQEGQCLCRLETTKAVYDLPAPCAGVVDYSIAEDTEVAVGAVICRIQLAVGASAPVAPVDPTPAVSTPSVLTFAASPALPLPVAGPLPVTADAAPFRDGLVPLFSRKAEALIAQLGMNRDAFLGQSLVGEAEVHAMAEKLGLEKPAAPAPISTLTPAPAPRATGPDDAVRFESQTPLERSKLYENRELLAADRAALKSTLHRWCATDSLAQAGAALRPPLSRLALIIAELAQTLRAHRPLNACLRDDRVAVYRDCSVGFAVDMGRGLKVLVIRNADTLTPAQIHEAVEDLVVKYATDMLDVRDVTGSTFTLTDLSAEGVFAFDPLLNGSQAAILGLGAEGELNGKKGFMLSCAFDHRMAGGRQVAEFLRDFAGRLSLYAPLEETTPPSVAEAPQPPVCELCFRSPEEVAAMGAYLLASAHPKGHICTTCLYPW